MNKKVITGIVLAAIAVASICGGLKYHQHKVELEELAKEKAREEKEIEEASSHITVGIKGDENTIVFQGEPYVESGAFGIDNRTGPIADCKITGKVDSEKPGIYKVKYTFKSGKGIKSITRDVKVVKSEETLKNTGGIPVISYHNVCTDDDYHAMKNRFCINASLLESHMKYLKDNDYYFPSFAELKAYVDGKISLPRKSVIVTFDDGDISFFKNGLSILEKLKVPATEFMIGKNQAEELIKQYPSRYLQFQNHSYGLHYYGSNGQPMVKNLSKGDIAADLMRNSNIVGNNDAFAYPYGKFSQASIEATSELGIPCVFLFHPDGIVRVGSNSKLLQRIEVRNTTSLLEFQQMVNIA